MRHNALQRPKQASSQPRRQTGNQPMDAGRESKVFSASELDLLKQQLKAGKEAALRVVDARNVQLHPRLAAARDKLQKAP